MNKKREQFLLFRIRAFRDERAFDAIIAQHGLKVRRFLELKLPRVDDAHDAASETWVRFWQYAQSTKIESVSGVVFTIARTIVADFYRKRGDRREQTLETEEGTMDISDPVHESIIDQIDVKLLKQFMQMLKAEDVQIIMMRYIEGHRIKDIAQQLGKTENATSVALHRAISKLRSIITERFN